MNRTSIKDLSEKLDGKKVLLNGWTHEIRALGKIAFLVLRDETGTVQAVGLKSSLPEELFKSISTISNESVVEIEGEVKKNKEAKKGYEVHINNIKILSAAEPLPITVTEKDKSIKTDLSTRLDNRIIDLRKPANRAIFNIQSAMVEGMLDYLTKNSYTQVFTPCIMGAASESGAEVFKIKYYKTEAFLRQDPQLHRQLTIAAGIEKLYDIGPSWRAEASHTTRHLCEHRTCAVELAFIKDEMDTMRVEENLVISALNKVKKKCQQDLELLGVKMKVPEAPFPELRFPKIYDILGSAGKEVFEGDDLDNESMKLLWEHVRKKHHAEFYFFNRFPFAHKPFYVMRVDEEPKWARSVDLNFKGLELSSGGQREHRYDILMNQAKEKNMKLKEVEWFTRFFKYGVPPHGGFALGIERLTQSLLSLPNIKEAVLFPRDPERLVP